MFSDAKVGIIFELARGFSENFSKMPKMEGQAGEQGAWEARKRESKRENRRRKRGSPGQEEKNTAGVDDK